MCIDLKAVLFVQPYCVVSSDNLDLNAFYAFYLNVCIAQSIRAVPFAYQHCSNDGQSKFFKCGDCVFSPSILNIKELEKYSISVVPLT